MRKSKILLPIIGGCAAMASTVPMMVSCSKNLITIDGPKTKTLTSTSDETEFKCKFTGENTPFYDPDPTIEEEKDIKASAMVAAYEIDAFGFKTISKSIVFESNDTFIQLDNEGKFTFKFTVDIESGKEIDFSLKIAVINGKGVYVKTFDGFKYTMK